MWHIGQYVTSLSGCHLGRVISGGDLLSARGLNDDAIGVKLEVGRRVSGGVIGATFWSLSPSDDELASGTGFVCASSLRDNS